MKQRIALSLMLSLLCTSCSTATVIRDNHSKTEARIVDGDEHAVWMVPNGSGQAIRVPRQNIRAIHHPGDGWIITGIVLIGMGVLSASTFGLVAAQDRQALGSMAFPMAASASYIGTGAVLWYTGHHLKETSMQRSQRSVGWSVSF